ncbi:protein eva-1-like [Nilaparvata lugens]|uniref:protein eva-1-like n=1 Tax=Nilaparvata lugens TaxID=108931 RepID=UPI00193D481C|nr:protein eva-1-like [Nilaparvata lugens]
MTPPLINRSWELNTNVTDAFVIVTACQVDCVRCIYMRGITAHTLLHAASALSATLRTYQAAACDDQPVSMRCPSGTSISVQVAQYGNKDKPLASLCQHHQNSNNYNTTSCSWPSILQYSLLQTVVEACQKKRNCRLQPAPNTTCPGTHHYVELAYKCRPSSKQPKWMDAYL